MVSGCSVDLKTKEIAKNTIIDQPQVVINNAFDLHYVENHAIAFGFMGSIKPSIRIPLIFVLTISASLLAFFMIWKIREQSFRILLPFFVIISGAYGNIIDRMLNGYVTDFFHVQYAYQYNFPVFNVADVLVNIGVILILLQWKRFKPLFDSIGTK